MLSFLSRLRAALFFWERGIIERLHRKGQMSKLFDIIKRGPAFFTDPLDKVLITTEKRGSMKLNNKCDNSQDYADNAKKTADERNDFIFLKYSHQFFVFIGKPLNFICLIFEE